MFTNNTVKSCVCKKKNVTMSQHRLFVCNTGEIRRDVLVTSVTVFKHRERVFEKRHKRHKTSHLKSASQCLQTLFVTFVTFVT